MVDFGEIGALWLGPRPQQYSVQELKEAAVPASMANLLAARRLGGEGATT